ncbi:regulatory protein GemA [Burkholderia arboris]|uniref:regulatory protein GemA n=1 Tax=Burkholderia arboris TaxID=488730 RepID=UPI00210BB85B|nr:regulatory protein GemA [Burkholderia arboris]UTV56161.1 regulatory protein GemA [Burkholderia arboris]
MALSTDLSKRDSQMVRLKAMKAGMSEDQYKDWLLTHFGVRSATDLSDTQRREAHARLHKLLDSMKPKVAAGAWNEPQLRKLSVLWAQLAACGAVRVNTDEALESWATRRIPTLSALRFARADQLQYLIEAAKQWMHRVNPDADSTA